MKSTRNSAQIGDKYKHNNKIYLMMMINAKNTRNKLTSDVVVAAD